MDAERQQRFEKVETGYNFPAMETKVQGFWEAEDIFGKSLAKPAPNFDHFGFHLFRCFLCSGHEIHSAWFLRSYV